MGFLAFIGAAALLYFVYSFVGYRKGKRRAAEISELAFSDYMKIKSELAEWQKNPDDTALRDSAIHAARKFSEITTSAALNTPAMVETTDGALRFTYCKQFVHFTAVDGELLGGTSGDKFQNALAVINTIDKALNHENGHSLSQFDSRPVGPFESPQRP